MAFIASREISRSMMIKSNITTCPILGRRSLMTASIRRQLSKSNIAPHLTNTRPLSTAIAMPIQNSIAEVDESSTSTRSLPPPHPEVWRELYRDAVARQETTSSLTKSNDQSSNTNRSNIKQRTFQQRSNEWFESTMFLILLMIFLSVLYHQKYMAIFLSSSYVLEVLLPSLPTPFIVISLATIFTFAFPITYFYLKATLFDPQAETPKEESIAKV